MKKSLSKLDRCERVIRRLRNNPRLWDLDDVVYNRLGLVQGMLRKIREQETDKQPRGPYSGLTRRELALSGTCETDWY